MAGYYLKLGSGYASWYEFNFVIGNTFHSVLIMVLLLEMDKALCKGLFLTLSILRLDISYALAKSLAMTLL